MPDDRQTFLPAPRSLRDLLHEKTRADAELDQALVDLLSQFAPLPAFAAAPFRGAIETKTIPPELDAILCTAVPRPAVDALRAVFALVRAREALELGMVAAIETIERRVTQ